MAGMFGSDYKDTKVMINDLANISDMYSKGKPSNDEGIMKAPKGEQVDAGSWWAWLNGYTRQKTQENIARVQEELSSMGVDTSGLSPEYQQSMLEGIQQAQAYRDKFGITQVLGDAPDMLEEEGVFPQTLIDVTDTGEGELSNPEPLYDMAKEIDPGTIETKELGLMSRPNATSPVPKLRPEEVSTGDTDVRLFDAVVGGESQDFDTYYGAAKVKPSKPLTQMTVAEVRDWQKQNVKAKSKSTAAGRFQIIGGTLQELIDKKIISKDDIFDEATQRKAYVGLLEKRGFSKFKNTIANAKTDEERRKAAEAFQLGLAKEFASIPIPYDMPNRKNPITGKGLKKGDSYYEGKSGNTTKHNPLKIDDYMSILMEYAG